MTDPQPDNWDEYLERMRYIARIPVRHPVSKAHLTSRPTAWRGSSETQPSVRAPRGFEERFPPISAQRTTELRNAAQHTSPKRQPVATPHTYLIAAEGSPLVKIGHTNVSPEKRLAGLQTGQPMLLTLLWSQPGDYERELHKRFSKHRVRGEWFDLTSLGDPLTVVQNAVEELTARTRT